MGLAGIIGNRGVDERTRIFTTRSKTTTQKIRDGMSVSIREALKLHPEDAELHCQLGDILLASGKQQDAIVQYAEALRVAPGYRKAQKGIRKANQANAGS